MSCLFHTPATPPDASSRRSPRGGFTLVEIMVTLVVISILAGMTMVGLNAARETARLEQTRGLVSRINQVLLNKWDEYHYRVLPVQLAPTAPTPSATSTPPQLLPEESGRIRGMMLRDLMRMEMPDRGSDLFIVAGSNLVLAGPTPVVAEVTTFGTTMVPIGATVQGIPWAASPQLARYQATVVQRVDAAPFADGDGSLSVAEFNQWIRFNESAECLYLVLSSISYDGVPALDMIAPYQIEDTDGDNMPEIVDAWDSPISWIRWPAGSGEGTIDATVADAFDILSSDWGARVEEVELAYSLTPMVISPGPDRALGIRTTQPPDPNFNAYHLLDWPAAATDNSVGDHIYIDPWIRNLTGGISASGPPDPAADIRYDLRPGAYLPAAGPGFPTGREQAADNISSFGVE